MNKNIERKKRPWEGRQRWARGEGGLFADAVGYVLFLQLPAVLQVVILEGQGHVFVFLPFVIMTIPCAGEALVRICGVGRAIVLTRACYPFTGQVVVDLGVVTTDDGGQKSNQGQGEENLHGSPNLSLKGVEKKNSKNTSSFISFCQ
ncbi:MAG: hypothetical protein V1848_03675 [Candidatus Magasanikbacteria bacterium]